MRASPTSSLTIDRARFFGMTFAMAGIACNTGPSPVVASVVDIPAQPPQPPDAGGVASDPPMGRAKPRAVAPEDEPEDDDVVEGIGSAFAEGGAVARAGGGCGWVDPSSVSRPGGKCSDDQAPATSCGVMKACQGFPFPRQKCEAYRKFFKPKVAAKALECLTKLNAAQACDACNTYRCGDLAMKSSCPDASANAACAQITSTNKSISMTECTMYLSGLNPAGRASMAACLTSTRGSFGIFSCAEGLL